MNFLDVDCTGLMPVVKFVKNGVMPLFQIGIPIVLIVLGTIDLGKAVVAGKDEDIKKNQNMLVKRAISAVAIFFVVTLVSFVFGMFGSSGSEAEGTSGDFMQCWNEA